MFVVRAANLGDPLTLVIPTITPEARKMENFGGNWDPDQANTRFRLTPEVKLDVYRTDAVVVRSYKPKCAGTIGERGAIGGAPSRRSLQNLVFLLNNSDVPFVSMLTMTMTPDVHKLCTVKEHRRALANALQRLRDRGISQYCWVREFQGNGSVHWHVFTDKTVGSPGEVNSDLSRDWCEYWASLYFDRIIPHSELALKKRISVGENRKKQRDRNKMETGNNAEFLGCCRFEQLRTDAAGRYAGKEGAKRFQKLAPGKWQNGGGAWWRASRGVKCTPIKRVAVPADTIESTSIDIGGKEVDVAYRVQFSRGLKER